MTSHDTPVPAAPPPASAAPEESRPSPSTVARLRGRAQAAQARAEAARATVPGVDAAFVVRSHDVRIGGNLLACAIAYRLFIWILPLSLVIAAILGFLHAAGSNDPADLAKDLGLSAYIASTVTHASEQAEGGRWIVLLVGLWGLYSASAGGAKTFAAVHGLVWGMDVRRPRKTVSAAAAFAGFGVLAVLVTLGAYWLRRESPGLGVAVTLAIFLVYAALWLVVSLALPHADAPWRRLLPGALFVALGAQLLHLVTVYYLAGKVQSSSELYGALGAAAAVLLWLYLIGRLAVGAALINATLWQRSRTSDGLRQR